MIMAVLTRRLLRDRFTANDRTSSQDADTRKVRLGLQPLATASCAWAEAWQAASKLLTIRKPGRKLTKPTTAGSCGDQEDLEPSQAAVLYNMRKLH